MHDLYRTTKSTLSRARRLRDDMTDAEKALWRELRAEQIGGHKFRKQVPIGPYVADFCCLMQKLVIEVDGGQHAMRASADTQRTRRLEEQGFRVLRFWNNDVLSNMPGVLHEIAVALNVALDR
ncbi:MAG TPA: DUF559 domain-containing protein [Dongiaceae bacterium]